MANKNISQFPATTTFSPDDLIPIWQGGQTKHISGSLFPYATDSELVATSGALEAFVVAASANAYAYTDAKVAPKADITLVAALTGAGLVDAKAYTDAASAALQAEIDAIIQEGTSVTSSGGTILVTQNGLVYNVDVIDPITATEVAALTGASLADAYAYTDAASAALDSRVTNLEALTPADIFRSEVASMSGSLVTISSDMSANALVHAKAYTDAASAALQTQIDQIVQEGTTITSSAGSITVTQNGTQFNVEVATAPVSNHNDLNGLQGIGGDGGYWHLTEAQYGELSGGLSSYTTLATTAAVSAGLDSRIGALEGNPVPDIFRSEVAAISASLAAVDATKADLTLVASISAGLAAVDSGLQSQVNAITATNILNLTSPAAGLYNLVYKAEDGKLYSDPAVKNFLIGKANNFVAFMSYDFREVSSSGTGWGYANATNVDTEGLTGGFTYTPTSTDSYMSRDVAAFNPFKYNTISITYKTPVGWTDRVGCQVYYYDSSYRLVQSPYLDPTYGIWKTEVLEVVTGTESVANSVSKIRFDLMNQAGYTSMQIAQIAVGYLGEAVVSTDASTLNGLTAAQITGASTSYTNALVAATSGSSSGVTLDTNQTITGIKTFVDLVNVSAGPGVQGCEVKFYDAGDYQGKIEAWNGAMYIISASGNTNVEITDYYGQLNGEWTLDGADPIVGLSQLQSVTGALDANVVHKTGTEDISGLKSFQETVTIKSNTDADMYTEIKPNIIRIVNDSPTGFVRSKLELKCGPSVLDNSYLEKLSSDFGGGTYLINTSGSVELQTNSSFINLNATQGTRVTNMGGSQGDLISIGATNKLESSGFSVAEITAASTAYTDALSASLGNNASVDYYVQSGTFSDPGGADGDLVYVV